MDLHFFCSKAVRRQHISWDEPKPWKLRLATRDCITASTINARLRPLAACLQQQQRLLAWDPPPSVPLRASSSRERQQASSSPLVLLSRKAMRACFGVRLHHHHLPLINLIAYLYTLFGFLFYFFIIF